MSVSARIADWVVGLRPGDLPADVLEATRLRVLDVAGLAAAGLETPFGAGLMRGFGAGDGGASVIGTDLRLAPAEAALVNGALAQGLEFDDTHTESVVHVSAPSVAAALALAATRPISGMELLVAIALGNEISARVGVAAPGQFHRRGYHPTGLFAPFGVACLAGRMGGLDAAQITHAQGIVGSFAAGLLQCWVDGTDTKYLHPGWAAQSGMLAARMAGGGVTGPHEVLEGRFGFFAAHLGAEAEVCDFARVTGGLGAEWESHNISFKPYPAAHVIHPYLDALLRLRADHGLTPDDVAAIEAPVAPYILPIVCAPVEEKTHPRSPAHARVSLQFCLAEALVTGRLDRHSFLSGTLTDDRVRALAARVHPQPDPSYPGPEQFKGAVRVRLHSGEVLEAVEEHTRGSRANPMSREAIEAKFRDNVSGVMGPARQAAVIAAVDGLADAADVAPLLALLGADGRA